MSLLDDLDYQQPTVNQSVADHGKIAAAMERIRNAGFSIKLLPGEKLLVSPRAKLSEAQVTWITANKPAIIAYLRSLSDLDDVKAIQELFGAKIKSVAMLPLPDQETPPESDVVRCEQCLHGQLFMPGDEYGQWRLCEAGLGAHFAVAIRECGTFKRLP